MALFTFIQAEFPWALGPTDGRYLLRDREAEPDHVLVLSTLGAPRRQRVAARRGSRAARPDPSPVAIARATVIDARAVPNRPAADQWLARAGTGTAQSGLAVVNRVLFAHRIAAADPFVHEVGMASALVLRAGYGEGEQVADGRWLAARELPADDRRPRRTAALRPQERLARLLSATHAMLVAEEFTLRARLDLDQGRRRHAAHELFTAYAVGLPELEAERRPDLDRRLAELRDLSEGVRRAAAGAGSAPPDGDQLRHALERLEATLRARTAAGVDAGTTPAAAATPPAERA